MLLVLLNLQNAAAVTEFTKYLIVVQSELFYRDQTSQFVRDCPGFYLVVVSPEECL